VKKLFIPPEIENPVKIFIENRAKGIIKPPDIMREEPTTSSHK